MFIKLRQQLFSAIERKYSSYFTMHKRPIRSVNFNRHSTPTPNLPPYAVILRGIIVEKNDFTLETVRMYGKLFPNAPIIVSTLENAPAQTLDALRSMPNAHVVLFKKTSPVGYGHINDQIDACVAALAKAKELGAAYALITRVDQRMYATDIYPFLLSLVESIPLASGTPQQKRIVTFGYLGTKYRTYSLNDMFFFGTLSDLALYWDIPHDTREISKLTTVGEWVAARVCEGYLFTTFLAAVGHSPLGTLEDYWEALGKYVVVIDAAMLDWYWIKYARYQEYRDRQYQDALAGEMLTFKDWLSLYQKNFDPGSIPTNLDALPNDMHKARIPS